MSESRGGCCEVCKRCVGCVCVCVCVSHKHVVHLKLMDDGWGPGASARFRRVLRRKLGAPTAAAFALVTATQFHLPFYMSRTLPNTFALVLTTLAGRGGDGWWCKLYGPMHQINGPMNGPNDRMGVLTELV